MFYIGLIHLFGELRVLINAPKALLNGIPKHFNKANRNNIVLNGVSEIILPIIFHIKEIFKLLI